MPPYKHITGKQAQYAALLAGGLNITQASRELGITYQTGQRWANHPLVMAEMDKLVNEETMRLKAKAIKRTSEIIESQQEFAALQASQAILAQAARVSGRDRTIRIEIGKMPEIGTPSNGPDGHDIEYDQELQSIIDDALGGGNDA